MFTGIIETLGTVSSINEFDDSESGGKGYSMRVTIDGGFPLLEDVTMGDSICINGTCLTVTDYEGHAKTEPVVTPPARTWFKVTLAPETLARTSLAELRDGSKVNLERAMQGHTRMGGHFVQGHVDGVVKIVKREEDGNSLRLRFAPFLLQGADDDREHGALSEAQAQELMSLVIEKGYVALDGTSLTVTEVSAPGVPAKDAYFGVMLIAYTQSHIVMPSKAVGDKVNLEVDMVGKYVSRITQSTLAKR